MNANIILAGQQPDFVNTLARSTEAAAQANAVQDQNRLRSAYQQHGAGIVAGEQNALNALAGISPQAAMGIQQGRQGLAAGELGMQRTQQVMQHADASQARLSREEQRQIEAQAAQMSAAERAAEAERIRRGVAMAMAQPTAEGFDAVVSQFDPSLVGSFGNRNAIAAKHLSMAEMIERMDAQEAGPQAADEYGRYMQEERAAGREPLSRIDYAQAKKGTETVFGPDGKPILQRGGKPSGGKLSERQSQLALFGNMMDTTMPVINDLEAQFDPSNLRDNLAARAGIAGNYVKSPEYRKYETAARAWGEGVLRIQTGAAATQPEIDRVFETYFAQPGDKPDEIAFKRQLRTAFAESIGVAGGGAIAVPNAPDEAPEMAPEPAPQITFQTPEQRSVFEKYSQP